MRLNRKERQVRIRSVEAAAWESIGSAPDELRKSYGLRPRIPIEIAVCPLGNEVNHGGILRIAEAFMLERVSFSFEDDKRHDFSGHLGAQNWQPYRWKDAFEVVEESKGRHIVALTMCDRSVSYQTIEPRFPMTIIVGSERRGVPSELVEKSDDVIAIPMYGIIESLNVAVATAIVIEHYASIYAHANRIDPIRASSKSILPD